MTESRPELLSLEQILKIEPREETFTIDKETGADVVTAMVRRNEEGQIVYVTPGSAKYLQKAPSPRRGSASAE